jgi:hypothetical protein
MHIRSFFTLALALALVSCGDGGSPTLDTGVPNNTQVDEITTAQARQICERAEDLVEDLFGEDRQHHLMCTGQGIAYDVADLGSCRSSYNDCINEPFEAEDPDFDCEAVDAPMLSGCNATIGELEACVNAQVKFFNDILEDIDCGLADDPDRFEALLAELEEGTDPSACAALPEECPDFFGDGMEEMAGQP